MKWRIYGYEKRESSSREPRRMMQGDMGFVIQLIYLYVHYCTLSSSMPLVFPPSLPICRQLYWVPWRHCNILLGHSDIPEELK